jgi:hypothetical protein
MKSLPLIALNAPLNRASGDKKLFIENIKKCDVPHYLLGGCTFSFS